MILRKLNAKKPKPRTIEELKKFALDDDKDDVMEDQTEDLRSMDYEKMKNRLEIVQKKNKKLEEEKNSLKMDKDQTMKTIENLLSQNRDLASENATLRDRQRRDARLVDSLRKNVNLLEARMQKIKEENKLLNESNLKAFKELQSMNQDKKELNKSYKGQHEEINKLLQDKEKDATKLQSMENRYTKLKTAFVEQAKTIDNLKLELTKYKQTLSDLKDEIKRYKLNEESSKASKVGKVDLTDVTVKTPPSGKSSSRKKKWTRFQGGAAVWIHCKHSYLIKIFNPLIFLFLVKNLTMFRLAVQRLNKFTLELLSKVIRRKSFFYNICQTFIGQIRVGTSIPGKALAVDLLLEILHTTYLFLQILVKNAASFF